MLKHVRVPTVIFTSTAHANGLNVSAAQPARRLHVTLTMSYAEISALQMGTHAILERAGRKLAHQEQHLYRKTHGMFTADASMGKENVQITFPIGFAAMTK